MTRDGDGESPDQSGAWPPPIRDAFNTSSNPCVHVPSELVRYIHHKREKMHGLHKETVMLISHILEPDMFRARCTMKNAFLLATTKICCGLRIVRSLAPNQ